VIVRETTGAIAIAGQTVTWGSHPDQSAAVVVNAMAAHNLRILENNPAADARNGMPATGRHIVTDLCGSLRLRDLGLSNGRVFRGVQEQAGHKE